jgi:hypothetical protein
MILNPSVPRHWLFAIAGILWTTVGLLLCARAVTWLIPSALIIDFVAEIAGILIASFGYLYVFSKVVKKNILRIQTLPDRPCVFAFTAWYGYLMIGSMMTFGILLRDSTIPKFYLVIPYTTMGLMLLIGSVQFYRRFIADAFLKK